MNLMAPEPITRAALGVLHRAAYTTRNLTLHEDVPVKQINDLWEAIHEIPNLICHWHDDAETTLLMYLDEDNGKWPGLGLRANYERARDEEKSD